MLNFLNHTISNDRSPAIVIAYLMKSKGWRLAQSYQWVKERRHSVELTPGMCVYCIQFCSSLHYSHQISLLGN